MNLGTHCSIIVRRSSLLVATDRDRVEGHHEVISINPKEHPHDSIVAVLRRFLPLGGRCSLIDNDSNPRFLAAKRDDSTALIDPHLLGVQTETDVVLVDPLQAVAALIRSANTASYDLTRRAQFDRTQSFALLQITEEASAATLDLAVVDASGVATPAATPFPRSVNLSRVGVVCMELIPPLLRELRAAPSVVIVLNGESATFSQVMADFFGHQLGGSHHPSHLLCDPYAALAGGLLLAQAPLEV